MLFQNFMTSDSLTIRDLFTATDLLPANDVHLGTGLLSTGYFFSHSRYTFNGGLELLAQFGTYFGVFVIIIYHA